MQFRGITLHSLYPAENLGGTAADVLTIAVRPMDLIIVVRDKAIVGFDELSPGLGMSNVPIGHPPLHILQDGDDIGTLALPHNWFGRVMSASHRRYCRGPRPTG